MYGVPASPSREFVALSVVPEVQIDKGFYTGSTVDQSLSTRLQVRTCAASSVQEPLALHRCHT